MFDFYMYASDEFLVLHVILARSQTAFFRFYLCAPQKHGKSGLATRDYSGNAGGCWYVYIYICDQVCENRPCSRLVVIRETPV